MKEHSKHRKLIHNHIAYRKLLDYTIELEHKVGELEEELSLCRKNKPVF